MFQSALKAMKPAGHRGGRGNGASAAVSGSMVKAWIFSPPTYRAYWCHLVSLRACDDGRRARPSSSRAVAPSLAGCMLPMRVRMLRRCGFETWYMDVDDLIKESYRFYVLV